MRSTSSETSALPTLFFCCSLSFFSRGERRGESKNSTVVSFVDESSLASSVTSAATGAWCYILTRGLVVHGGTASA